MRPISVLLASILCLGTLLQICQMLSKCCPICQICPNVDKSLWLAETAAGCPLEHEALCRFGIQSRCSRNEEGGCAWQQEVSAGRDLGRKDKGVGWQNAEISDGKPGMVDVLFWSRKGHWGLGMKRRKWQKFEAGKKVWVRGRGTEKPALFSVLIPQAFSLLVENCQLILLK